MNTNSKNNIIISIVVVALFVVGVSYLIYHAKPVTTTDNNPPATTPTPVGMDMSNWKTTKDTNSGVTFQYPEKLNTTYINTVDWPPQVQVISGPFSCTDAGEPNAQAGQTLTKIINGRSYCVTTVSEGAAGSTYNQYAYEINIKGQNVYFTFTLRFPQCDNYDDPQKTACKTERVNFNIDSIMDQIIQTSSF